jgi:heme exporter protein CcmD
METTPLAGEDIIHYVALAYGFTALVLMMMIIVTVGSYRRVRTQLTTAEQAGRGQVSQ